MKSYLEISIPAEESSRELLLPPMLEMGCHGFLQTEDFLIAYADKARFTPEECANLRDRVSALLRAMDIRAEARVREIPEENWNRQWEDSIEPVEIGRTLVIKPSWRSYARGKGKIILEIDPKMSFGTGHHETTRLCLRLLERYLNPGDRVLDVGTGTGILAIAAIRLGGDSAVGIDVDEWSIANARENVRLNRLESCVRIAAQSLEKIPGEAYDCVVANLTLDAIATGLAKLAALTVDGGSLILSGFLRSDVAAIDGRLPFHGLVRASRLHERDWAAVLVRKA